jgi:hypothetical protein
MELQTYKTSKSLFSLIYKYTRINFAKILTIKANFGENYAKICTKRQTIAKIGAFWYLKEIVWLIEPGF